MALTSPAYHCGLQRSLYFDVERLLLWAKGAGMGGGGGWLSLGGGGVGGGGRGGGGGGGGGDLHSSTDTHCIERVWYMHLFHSAFGKKHPKALRRISM